MVIRRSIFYIVFLVFCTRSRSAGLRAEAFYVSTDLQKRTAKSISQQWTVDQQSKSNKHEFMVCNSFVHQQYWYRHLHYNSYQFGGRNLVSDNTRTTQRAQVNNLMTRLKILILRPETEIQLIYNYKIHHRIPTRGNKTSFLPYAVSNSRAKMQNFENTK